MKSQGFIELSDTKMNNRFIFESTQPKTEPKNENFIPKPIFCLKTQDSHKNKIFINFCVSDIISQPETMDEHEIMKKVSKNSGFKIPIFVSSPHKENDNDGIGFYFLTRNRRL